MLLRTCFASLALLAIVCIADRAQAADAPKVSTFAPAEDLVGQAEKYLKDIEASVASEAEYKESVEKLGRDSNTLIVIALALGLHDEDNSYKASAPALVKAAQDLAATKDYDSAKKAVAAVKDAAAGKAKADGQLKWEKVAALPELMKQVPTINTKLKLNVNPKKLAKKAKDSQGQTAVLAVIAQGTLNDTSVAKGDEQIKQWQAFSAAARDDAGAVNAAIRKGDAAEVEKAMTKLNESCEACHKVFKPETTTTATN